MTNNLIDQRSFAKKGIILGTDGYKLSHHSQYPPGMERLYSYFEARAGGEYPATTFFGLQYILKRHLVGKVVTKEEIDFAEWRTKTMLGRGDVFNRKGWERILNEHDGQLPLIIKAVPEGMTIPESNVLMTVENTDPELAWLTNYVETLLTQVWYPTTVCTVSREMKKLIWQAILISGTETVENLLFRLHDFGYRGVTCDEQAGIGGMAHLVNFLGTDTLAAVDMAWEFYGEENAGFTIPATEHSTITTWGEAGEEAAFENYLEVHPDGTIACVSDSWDIYRACGEIWGGKLRAKVLERDGVLVVRPDSGEPTEVVPEVLRILWQRFGGTTNPKGYKVLCDKMRIIQGDGIGRDTLWAILQAVMNDGFSVDNISFGSGGGLLQKVDRDTQRFAFKASWTEINGVEQDVFKRPATDPTKDSKRGRLMLAQGTEFAGGFKTLLEGTPGYADILRPVFENGELLIDEDFATIRKRAEFV